MLTPAAGPSYGGPPAGVPLGSVVVRIPSGDLSPARRRRYGGTYGRRRRRTLRGLLVLVLLVVAGGGALWLLKRDDTQAPSRRQTAASGAPAAAATPTPCVTAPPAPARPVVLPAPGTVKLVLLNGTPRNGLGRSVGNQLAARGFKVAGTGNAPRPQAGPTTVVFGPGAQPGAMVVARAILGSTLAGNPKAPAGTLQVVLGTTFTRLRTPAEVAALGRTAVPPAAKPVCR